MSHKTDISNAIAEYLSVHDNLAYEVEMSDWERQPDTKREGQ